jgi:hypothetical protein
VNIQPYSHLRKHVPSQHYHLLSPWAATSRGRCISQQRSLSTAAPVETLRPQSWRRFKLANLRPSHKHQVVEEGHTAGGEAVAVEDEAKQMAQLEGAEMPLQRKMLPRNKSTKPAQMSRHHPLHLQTRACARTEGEAGGEATAKVAVARRAMTHKVPQCIGRLAVILPQPRKSLRANRRRFRRTRL